ncbi:MAG: hypothetical protein H0V15_06970 [Solirubrobacterales bacterium]|nr:hypothetical protein [Solirubrobacterales bacterium]
MTPLSKDITRFLAAAIAVSLVAAAPAGAARGGKQEGPSATVVTGAPVTIAGQFSAGTASVSCPKGTQATAGGFASTLPTRNAQWIDLYESLRVGTRGWRVSGVQAHTGSGTLTASAYCEPLKGKLRTRSLNVPLGAVGSTATGLAKCPGGTKVLSGGFEVPPANATASSYVSRSIAGNGVGWVVDATRLTGAAASLTAFAYCADVTKIKTRSASAPVLGSSGLAQTATTPVCPKKKPLRGGGFATSTPVNGLLGSALVYESRPSGESWLSSAVAGGEPTASTLVTNAYCR